ncbi:hypothetical protein [Streptomyces sp. SP18CS02]|uniref:hypothetical protein n=1 Tax=Streptomyces sp. SP18CS02 TaxID=3002531 RepID=UPI002E7A7157|nr:hypothetical protein [Streptomyces sp. SP18CS02]MEE1752117.1 hypothetical protein [Streptomyces sp. SP18CS02]
MAEIAPHTDTSPARPALLWGVSAASLAIFLLTWAAAWVKAYVVNDDLPNFCGRVVRGSFPPEVACVSANGTVTGGNAGWVDALFFTSLAVCVVPALLASAITAIVRRR